MAIPVLGHRLYDGAPSGRSGSAGVDQDVLHFLVRGQTFKAAMSLQGSLLDDNSVFPVEGDPHPDFGYQVRAAAFSAGEVTGSGPDMFMKIGVLYNREGQSFSSPPPDDTAPGYTAVSLDTKSIDITVPYFIGYEEKTFQVPYLSAGSASTITYTLQERTVSVSGAIYTREVSVPTFGGSDAAVISSQHDKVHTFGGKKWQFKGASVSRVSVDQYNISYHWFTEPGNGALEIDVPASSRAPIMPPARDPFQQYFVGVMDFVGPPEPGTIAPLTIPYIIARDVLVEEAAGWAVLPGIGANP